MSSYEELVRIDQRNKLMNLMMLRIAQSLLLPPSIILFLGGFGLVVLKKRPHIGKCLMVAGIFSLYIISIGPVTDMLIRPLEESFTPFKKPFNSANVIVILGGGVIDLSTLGMKPVPSNTSTARLIYGITLYREYPGSTLIISGGSGEPDRQDISEADAMKEMAISLGVPAIDIFVENSSGSTIESVNALRALIKRKKVILVTSAYHMKRAVAMFRKVGIEVIPASTDYVSERRGHSFYSFIPKASNLMISTIALSEYMSYTWYTLKGNV